MNWHYQYLILFFMLLQSSIASTQIITESSSNPLPTQVSKDSFRFSKFIAGDFLYMNADVLDNIYLITPGNQLKKLNSKGDSVAVFNDVKKYGNPTYVDVSNPLKILVYYKNFSTVVVLDRNLIYRNNINLRKQQIFSVQAVATSYDNNIWVFDEQDYKLKKIDEDGKIMQESTDMRLLIDTVPSPVQLIDSESKIFLYDMQRGFYIFDYYGALKNNIPFRNWTNIAIARKVIYGFSEASLYTYQLESLQLQTYPLPSWMNGHLSVRAINGKVYVLKKDGLYIYELR
ncbi:MAG: hypothetical protein NTZ41_12120 [Sphingobacteriales bacterium]|jgi:hypothetical protein|nr:hypothetical protein [Sphingobacteriales bacterium]